MDGQFGYIVGSLITLPGPEQHFSGHFPSGSRPTRAAATNCRTSICSQVAFNDIKHLTRSMPADGLEAQDVVPPRCGWVAHKPSILPAFSHARARQPSQLSLISLAFLSRVRKYGRQRVSLC